MINEIYEINFLCFLKKNDLVSKSMKQMLRKTITAHCKQLLVDKTLSFTTWLKIYLYQKRNQSKDLKDNCSKVKHTPPPPQNYQ